MLSASRVYDTRFKMGYPVSLRFSHSVVNNNNNIDNNKNKIVDDTVRSATTRSLSNCDIRTSLQTSILEARREERITCGVYQAARMLENKIDDVMLCILAADDFDDLELHIHFTLLEAFCWENEISLIKVDSASKLWKLLHDDNVTANDNDFASSRRNVARSLDCVLLHFPKEVSSPADEIILDFCKTSGSIFPRPIIDLLEG